MLIFLTLLIPLLGGAAMGFIRFPSNKARAIYVEAVVCTTSLLVLSLLLTRTDTTYVLFHLTAELPLTFRIDGMSTVFAGLVALLWPIASLYGFEYMHHEERENTFFAWYTMSYAATLAVAFSANLFTLYVFYECLTLITLPLVIHKKDTMSIRAGRKYLTYSITGAALAFIALVCILHFGGTTNFVLGGVLEGASIAGVEPLLLAVFVLAFIGFGTKAAVFPMHAWLPAASVAPTPVTALLHAVAVVNTGAFAVLRIIYYSFGAKRVNLWHGVGVVKGVGCASKEYQRRKEKHKLIYAVKESLERIELYRQFVIGTGGWGDFYFLSPTETDTKQFSQFSYIPQKNFIESQYPRTCPCVRLTPREQEILAYMKHYDKVVMYLPTFRTGSNRFDFSNIAEQLEDVLEKENILWVQKAHSASSTVLNQEEQGHILNLEPAFDINVLMPHCDLLVTDYSSAASDARFFRKPVLFYVPDLEEYTNGDNGITPEAEELMRGPQLFDMETLREWLVKATREPESAKPADYEDIRTKYWGEDKDYRQIWNEICRAVDAKKHK